ncbi:MAG: DNA-binding protein [Deltaproteobacteria bacterium]|nr:DNA-binding protein [Deltaproteobacteria bacterium]
MEQRVFGPERKIDPKDQPRGTWKEQQAADYIGMKVATLRQWRFLSKGPVFLKIGRSCRYRKEDLDAFLEKSAVNPLA